MQSQCPHCCSSFDIPETALAAAEGIVRCGQCMQLFNAVDNEVTEAKDEASSQSEIDEAFLNPIPESELESEPAPEPEPEPEPSDTELDDTLSAASASAPLETNTPAEIIPTEPTAPIEDTPYEQSSASNIDESLSHIDESIGHDETTVASGSGVDNSSQILEEPAETGPLTDIPSLESYHDAIVEDELSEESSELQHADERDSEVTDALVIPEFFSSNASTNASTNVSTSALTTGEEEPFEVVVDGQHAAHESTNEETFLFENEELPEEEQLFTLSAQAESTAFGASSDSSAHNSLSGLTVTEDQALDLISLDDSSAIEEVSLAPLATLRDGDGDETQRGIRHKGAKALFAAASLVLCLGLAIQWLAATGKHTLLPENVSDTLFSKVCQAIYCEKNEIDLAYESLEFLMHSHPDTPNALLLKTTLINAGEEPLPFPHLLLEFSNLENELLARREFKPEEYLGQDLLQSNNLLKNNTPIEIQLELADPGNDAVNYTIHYFLPTS